MVPTLDHTFFKVFSLCLNDLVPSRISRPGSHGLQSWQRANARANLWWRHKPFSGETNIALRTCAGKAWVAKRSWWCWVSFHPTDVVKLAWYARFWRKFTFNRAQDVDSKPLLYSADYGACWSRGSHSNSAREISRGWACHTECMLH